MAQSSEPEIIIAGAGIIGLTVALELIQRGHRVAVLERGRAMSQSSRAAAGMLAAGDPANPAALLPLASWSADLWPGFLERLNGLAGTDIQFQTVKTLQRRQDGVDIALDEHSIDPREVAEALLLAVRRAGTSIREDVTWSVSEDDGLAVTADGDTLRPERLIHATGAWFAARRGVVPCKGQMLRVRMPVLFQEVHRAEHVYVVPRLYGPQAGSALIGATVENAGFDTTTDAASLAILRQQAAELCPELADERAAPVLEAWAGLRPATPDGLPLLGFVTPRQYVACGHFRNGVLLAPATARAVADALEGRAEAVPLAAFDPHRFFGVG